MVLKNNKSTWAALATLSVTAIAAGATAIMKIRNKREQKRKEKEEAQGKLTAEQDMVYNQAVRAFITLNDKIYDLRLLHKELQPIIQWLATDGEKPVITTNDQRIVELMNDIEKFLVNEVPFINACINTISDDSTTYPDYVRAAAGKPFDSAVDEEYNHVEPTDCNTIKQVLKLGYFFPYSRIAPSPVKSIVLV